MACGGGISISEKQCAARQRGANAVTISLSLVAHIIIIMATNKYLERKINKRQRIRRRAAGSYQQRRQRACIARVA